MGIPVTVDSEKLETLLHATGCVKAMETAVHAAKTDPLRAGALPSITAAHDELASALRGAYRARNGYIREPTEKDLDRLRHHFLRGDDYKQFADFPIHDNPQDLAGVGFVWVGLAHSGVMVEWAAPWGPQFMHDGSAPFYRARLLSAGMKVLEDILLAEREKKRLEAEATKGDDNGDNE